jgi:hypothetical protein
MPEDFDLPEGARPLEDAGDASSIKWDKPGARIIGRLVTYGESKKYPGTYWCLWRTDSGKVFSTAPIRLLSIIQDRDLVGKRLAVIYVGEEQNVKHFKIGIFDDQKAESPPPEDVEDDDLPF